MGEPPRGASAITFATGAVTADIADAAG